MARRLIEVERRFIIPKNCKQQLQRLGAKLISLTTFRDIYYDTEKSALCLNDHWLRKRDSTWELKCPPETRADSRTAAQYMEVSCARDIIRRITPFIKPTPGRLPYYMNLNGCGEHFHKEKPDTHSCDSHSTDDLKQMYSGFKKTGSGLSTSDDKRQQAITRNVNCDTTTRSKQFTLDSPLTAAGRSHCDMMASRCEGGAYVKLEALLADTRCEPFATIDTERRLYALGELSVALDVAGFGYEVGEVERLVEREQLMQAAVSQIDALLARLGCEGSERVPGKIDTYLKIHRPELHRLLFTPPTTQ